MFNCVEFVLLLRIILGLTLGLCENYYLPRESISFGRAFSTKWGHVPPQNSENSASMLVVMVDFLKTKALYLQVVVEIGVYRWYLAELVVLIVPYEYRHSHDCSLGLEEGYAVLFQCLSLVFLFSRWF